MGADRNQSGRVDDDPFLAALTSGAQSRPESRVLDPLLGDWRADTDWDPRGDGQIRRSQGRVENRWILDGRVLESCSFDEQGDLTTRFLLAYDPTVDDYVGFCVHVLSSSFVLERGAYDATTSTLALDAHEPLRNRSDTVHYRRSITFGSDGYTTAITYPGVPDGTYGPMVVRHGPIA